MRILRVAQKCYPDVTGGGAYHVHAMSRDQAAMGHDVTVLTLRWDENRPRRESRDGYEVVRCPPTVSVLGNDLSVGLARELFGAEGYDVVHAHSHLYAATNLAAVRRRLAVTPFGRRFDGTPLAITNHGVYSQSVPRWLFRQYLRTLGRLTLDSADLLFCYTEADRARLRSFGVDTDVAVVSNGIDETRFSPVGPEHDRIPDGDPVVLFVGRLVEGKRPGDAIDAVARLVEDHPSMQLVVVGDGPQRDALGQRVRSLGLSDTVTFLGTVPYDEMPSVYRGADVFVLPSEAEGVPRTMLEALATGTPAVTTDLEQLAEFTDHGVEQVPVGDVGALASALHGLLAAPDRRRVLGERGRARIEERYTWSGTVEETTINLATLVE